MPTPTRLNLRDLKPKQVAPMEEHFTPAWPDSWRDFALSVYVTLISLHNWKELSEAELAVAATQGIAKDLGGTQPYITVGTKVDATGRIDRVLELLKVPGASYRDVATELGLTENWVRRIESEARKPKKKRIDLRS